MDSSEVLLVPLVIGLVQAAKGVGLPTRLVPIFTLSLAVIVGYFVGTDWIQGLVLGLSAMGLWSGGKAVSGK